MDPEYTLLGLLRRPATAFELEARVRDLVPTAGPGGLGALRETLAGLAERGWIELDPEAPQGGLARRTEAGTAALLAWLRAVPPPAACGDAFAQRLAFADALDPEEALSLAVEERERLRLAAEELEAVLRRLAHGVEDFPRGLGEVEYGHYVATRLALSVLRSRASATGEALRHLTARRDAAED